MTEHPNHPGMGGPGSPDLGGRLEMLVTRLEQLLARLGGGGQPGGFGGGAFPRPGAGGPGALPQNPPAEGARPQGLPGGFPRFEGRGRRPQPEGTPGGPNAGPGGGTSNNDLRAQLQQMQERQEKMSRAIRDLSEALERTQRK